MGAYGDGGIVTTNDGELYEKLRVLRYVGQRIKFVHEVIGFQERPNELRAAALSVKLRYLDEWNNSRRKWADLYDMILAEVPVVRPYVAPYAKHVYYSYAILVKADERVVNLPIFPHLREDEVCAVAQAVVDFFRK